MILLAGGSGRLGTLIVRRLQARGLAVRVLTRDRRRTESATIAHVAFDQFDLWLVEMSGAPTVAGEHANGEASRL